MWLLQSPGAVQGELWQRNDSIMAGEGAKNCGGPAQLSRLKSLRDRMKDLVIAENWRNPKTINAPWTSRNRLRSVCLPVCEALFEHILKDAELVSERGAFLQHHES